MREKLNSPLFFRVFDQELENGNMELAARLHATKDAFLGIGLHI